MNSPRRRFRRGRSGQAAIEFALILPVLFAILVLVQAGGLMVAADIKVTRAAPAGVQAALAKLIIEARYTANPGQVPLNGPVNDAGAINAACDAVRQELELDPGQCLQKNEPQLALSVASTANGTNTIILRVTYPVDTLIATPGGTKVSSSAAEILPS